MDTFFLDIETFYSTEFSLTRLDIPSYVLSPLFEAICLGVAKNTDRPFIVDRDDIPEFLHSLPPNVAAVSHNALFDFCVFSWRYDWRPKLICDTLSMSRSLLSHKLKSHSLRSVSKHLNLPEKGGFLSLAKGMTYEDLHANGFWQQYTEYCLNDVELCRYIYLELASKLPDEEFLIHDMVARCAVEPMFRLNADVLAEHLAAVKNDKELTFAKAMLAGIESKTDLMSNDRFAQVLESLGVDPPRKISPATGQLTWAFSKNDLDFLELVEHEDPRVQVVMAARLGHKSTIEETRTERMLNISRLNFPYHGGTGIMPIPLKVGAAITHRLGGDWKLNAQNWGRQSPIRRAVEAPEGWVIVACDAAQIEARGTCWFCGQQDMVEQFARGEDVYAIFASVIYGYPVNKKDHPVQRFVGKTGVLQLGYQCGHVKFARTVFVLSAKDGEPIILTDAESINVVTTYRHTNYMISNKWSELGAMIPLIASAGAGWSYVMGPVTFYRNKIVGPNGLAIYYENLGWDAVAREFAYEYGGRRYKLYGGKMLENIVQFLARVATMQAALRIKKRTHNLPVRFVHQAHDELVYLTRPEVAAELQSIVSEEMSRTPDWAPGLPLKGEAKIGYNYGEMK